MAARLRERWKRSGLIKGPGIPSPSGHYTVGCVDLMQRLSSHQTTPSGSNNTGLLVRLFYPCSVPPQEEAAYQYAKWMPHKQYTRGFLEFTKTKMAGFLSGLINLVMDPRLPALEAAPLFQESKAAADVEEDTVQKDSSDSQTLETGGSEADRVAEGDVSVDIPSPSSDVGQQQRLSTSEEKTFPVIVYSHGLGAMRTVYSGICCDLASHGYVVAAVEHKDRSACVTLQRVPKPDGQPGQLVDEWLEFYHRPENEAEFPLRNDQVKQRASEARQTLDLLHLLNDGAEISNMLEETSGFDYGQFKGRLNVATAAVMGHSFGGATTIQTLSEDSRFMCGIGLDTWMLPVHRDVLNVMGIEQPLLFINSFDFQWKENVKKMLKLIKPPDERGMSQCSLITLKDTNHYNQSDILFVMPIGQKTSRLPLPVAHQVNQELCHAFLKRHLLKDSEFQRRIPNLDGGEGCSEIVIHGTNVDLSEPSTSVEQQEAQREVTPAAENVVENEVGEKMVEKREGETEIAGQEERENQTLNEEAETTEKLHGEQ